MCIENCGCAYGYICGYGEVSMTGDGNSVVCILYVMTTDETRKVSVTT